MHLSKNMKAGYQGKHDSMRAMAEKLMNHPGHAPDVIESKDAASKDKMRPYKTGGHVKKETPQAKANMKFKKAEKFEEKREEKEHKDYKMRKHKQEEKYEGEKKYAEKHQAKAHKDYEVMKKKKVPHFAAGGVAKIRHGEATAKGAPKQMPKGCTSSVYY